MREARVSIGEAEYEALGIDDLVTLCQEAGLRDFDELVCHGTGAVLQVEVDDRLDGDRLDAIEYVTEWEHVETDGDTNLYVVSFEAPELSQDIVEPMDELVGTCEPEVGDDGATLSLVGPQDAIAATIDGYEQEGISPDLRRLGGYRGRPRPLDKLTRRQQEVIQTAFDMGYYEVPREVSTQDVAAELSLDPSTVAEHLQRAERNLLGQHLSAE